MSAMEGDQPAVPAGRRPWAAIAGGVVGVVLALAGWWAQDAIGTLVNEGEARTGERVAFTADAGRYRVVSSGPLRPSLSSYECDVDFADGSHRTIIGGTAVNAIERLGTTRLLEFHAPAGPTAVTCRDRRLPDNHHGRFQVIAAGGPVDIALYVLVGLGIAGILGGIGVLVLRSRRN